MTFQKSRNNSLDSLRFFAASLVFFSHVGLQQDSFLMKALSSGYAGVSIFFILSGYVLGSSETAFAKPTEFLLRRAIRIFPSLLILSMAFIPIFSFSYAYFFSMIGIHALIPNSNYYYAPNTPTWSISTEICFYLALPIILKNYLYNPRRISLYFVVILTISFIIDLFGFNDIYFGEKKILHYFTYVSPISRIVEFLSGVFLSRCVTLPPLSKKHFFVSCTLLVFYLGFNEWFPDFGKTSLFVVPLTVLFFASYLSAFTVKNETYRKTLLDNRFLALLGRSSYAFYISHFPLLIVLRPLIWSFFPDNISNILFSYIIIWIFSVGFYVFVETPIQCHFKRKLDGRNAIS